MKYLKKYTVKEWKTFCNTWTGDRVNGEELTAAEILLDRYKIILTDHTNKKRIGGFVKVSLKEKLKNGLKNLPSKINQKNFDKGMQTFDKGMAEFSKEMDALSKGLGGNGTKPKLYSSSKQDNVKKLMGSSPNKVKIWSSKPVQKKRKTKRKTSKSDKWDQHEANLTKIWGKKK